MFRHRQGAGLLKIYSHFPSAEMLTVHSHLQNFPFPEFFIGKILHFYLNILLTNILKNVH